MLSFCMNAWEDRLSARTPISSGDLACGHFKALVRRQTEGGGRCPTQRTLVPMGPT